MTSNLPQKDQKDGADQGCQMAIARFLDCMCLALWARRTIAPLRCAARFDPFLSLDCAGLEGVGAQSRERKGSNFAAQRSRAIVQKPEGPNT